MFEFDQYLGFFALLTYTNHRLLVIDFSNGYHSLLGWRRANRTSERN